MKINKLIILFVISILFISPVFAINSTDSDVTYLNYEDNTVSCGGGLVENIPSIIPKLTRIVYNIIQIIIPILLVIFCMIDLIKAIIAGKDDEIKKHQGTLIKRMIVAVIVFLMFVLVKFFISVLAEDNAQGIMDCASCFINDEKYCEG